MILDDYVEYCSLYNTRYDVNLVLMEVGSFFELYAVNNETETVGADIYRIAELLNLQVSRKNKSILENSRQNPLMAGFPEPALAKFIPILLANSYTVILVRQVTPPPNCKREVTDIISSATWMESGATSSVLGTIFFSEETCPLIGIALFDCTIGKTWVHQLHDVEEAYHVLQIYRPVELLQLGHRPNHETLERLNFKTKLHQRFYDKKDKKDKQEIERVAYQNQFFSMVYKNKNKTRLSNLEWLDLERSPEAATALVGLLQFVYEHQERLILNLEKPTVGCSSDSLVLHYNALEQLDITGDRGLAQLLNRCRTPLGRRLFHNRMLHPLIDAGELEARYLAIEDAVANGLHERQKVHFQKIQDLERVKRRLELKLMHPLEFVNLDVSLKAAHQLSLKCSPDIQELMGLYDCLDMDVCGRLLLPDVQSNLFKVGRFPDLDLHQAAVDTLARRLDSLAIAMECKLDFNERDGYHLITTKRRAQNLKPSAAAVLLLQSDVQFVIKPVSATSSSVKLTHPSLEAIHLELMVLRAKLGCASKAHFDEFLNSFESHLDKLQTVADQIAEHDVICTNARNATEFGYVRPSISNMQNPEIDVKGLRHPLIERLNDAFAYQANDVKLTSSQELQDQDQGLLLYGINAAGKSSLMKAIGCGVIMAQSGQFVAARSMHFALYRHLFTRIQGNDNILKGQSSFTVEMMELRNILNCTRNATDHANALVLGDELCHGTESVSAIAIVSAGILTLLERKVHFVFATHLHELVDMQVIKNKIDKGLGVYHLEVRCDPVSGKLIYDRKLKPGQGSTQYGLEVCKSLGLDESFVALANTIRREVLELPKHLLKTKTSPYNSSLYVDRCSVCDSPAQETHHIKYQVEWRNRENVFQRDAIHNLAPLCSACHDAQHHGQLQIQGYVETSEGRELVFSDKTEKKQEKKQTQESREEHFFQEFKEKLEFRPQLGWYEKRGSTWVQVRQIQQFVAKRLETDCEDIRHFINTIRPMFLRTGTPI